MTDYIKEIERPEDLNDDECLSGYRAGCGFIAVDHTQKSASYWHGYRNAMVDRGLEPMSPEQAKFARECLKEWRETGIFK